MEKRNGTISFLDVKIKINPNGFDTWTWRKPTHTSLFLNFCAVCPKAWKEDSVLCLLHRAKTVCSSVKFFKTEVDNLRGFLRRITISSIFSTRFWNVFYINQKHKHRLKMNQTQKFCLKYLLLAKYRKIFLIIFT